MFLTKVLSEMCVDHDGQGGRVTASEAQGGTVIPIPAQLCDGDSDEGAERDVRRSRRARRAWVGERVAGGAVVPMKVLFQCS